MEDNEVINPLPVAAGSFKSAAPVNEPGTDHKYQELGACVLAYLKPNSITLSSSRTSSRAGSRAG